MEYFTKLARTTSPKCMQISINIPYMEHVGISWCWVLSRAWTLVPKCPVRYPGMLRHFKTRRCRCCQRGPSQLNFNQKRCTPKYWMDFSRHFLKLELWPGCKIERKPASVNCFVSHRTCQRPMRINQTLENIQTCPKADSDQMLLRCRETLFLFNFQCRKTYHTFSACFFPPAR